MYLHCTFVVQLIRTPLLKVDSRRKRGVCVAVAQFFFEFSVVQKTVTTYNITSSATTDVKLEPEYENVLVFMLHWFQSLLLTN